MGEIQSFQIDRERGVSVLGGVSRVTGTVGKIATDWTFDEDAISKRKRLSLTKERPQDVGDGMVRGGKSLVKGLWGGVSGLVTQPVKDVKAKGVSGLGTGIGKGLAGLVLKPVVGVMDAATNITVGMAKTPEVSMHQTVLYAQCDLIFLEILENHGDAHSNMMASFQVFGNTLRTKGNAE